eukprot:997520-Heterocapsa_arctica.AAC.1
MPPEREKLGNILCRPKERCLPKERPPERELPSERKIPLERERETSLLPKPGDPAGDSPRVA